MKKGTPAIDRQNLGEFYRVFMRQQPATALPGDGPSSVSSAPDDSEQAYFSSHAPIIEAAITAAVNACLSQRPSDPVQFIASAMQSQASGGMHHSASSRRTGTDGEGISDEWTIAAWLASLSLHEHMAQALLRSSAAAAESQVSFVRSLAAPSGLEVILDLLRAGEVLEKVAQSVHAQAQVLASAEAATANELVAKFCQQSSAFSMTFSGLSTFFSGLEGLVGAPSPRLADAIAREHCKASDSRDEFVTPNYSVTTSSEVEYTFIADPSAGLASLRRDAWPAEVGLRSDQTGRVPTPLAAFEDAKAGINERLRNLDSPPLGQFELMAARLYTGPMYVKYNAVLRGALPSSTTRDMERLTSLCKGNRCKSIRSALWRRRVPRQRARLCAGSLPDHTFTPLTSSGRRHARVRVHACECSRARTHVLVSYTRARTRVLLACLLDHTCVTLCMCVFTPTFTPTCTPTFTLVFSCVPPRP